MSLTKNLIPTEIPSPIRNVAESLADSVFLRGNEKKNETEISGGELAATYSVPSDVHRTVAVR